MCSTKNRASVFCSDSSRCLWYRATLAHTHSAAQQAKTTQTNEPVQSCPVPEGRALAYGGERGPARRYDLKSDDSRPRQLSRPSVWIGALSVRFLNVEGLWLDHHSLRGIRDGGQGRGNQRHYRTKHSYGSFIERKNEVDRSWGKKETWVGVQKPCNVNLPLSLSVAPFLSEE